MPPATGPSSSTATRLPARERRYAVVRPAMPAPTMHTSTCTFCPRGTNCGSAAVAAQIDWWRLIATPPQQETVLNAFLAHGDELFCGRGVNADRGVELRLGGAELHRDRHAL